MSDWKETSLKSLTSKIGSGATPRGGSNNYKLSGMSLIRSQNVLDFQFSTDGLALIDDEQAAELSNVSVEPNDVLLNITGDSVARCCMVPKYILPARVNQHVAIIRSKPECADHRFIYYALQANKEELLNRSEIGATRRALTKGMIEDFPINSPTLPEQRAIAGVLSNLDDKIELLHRQNGTLEAMAETLFRKWFVEEANESQETVALGEVLETCSGGTPSRSKMEFYEGGTIRWVKSKELTGSFIVDTEERITEDALKTSAAKLLPENSILVALYGATVGEYALLAESMSCNQAVCAVKPNTKYPHTYLFMYFKHIKDDLINMAVGSAQQNISQVLVRQLELSANVDRIQDFHRVMCSGFEKMKSNIYQIRTLEKLRDTLLPKLMSGDVSVQYE